MLAINKINLTLIVGTLTTACVSCFDLTYDRFMCKFKEDSSIKTAFEKSLLNSLIIMLPIIPKISQLAPGIIRILGMNPSAMTLQGTNSYIIGMPPSKSRLLIDTSNHHQEGYIENIRQYISENIEALPIIKTIIITHWHPDHIGAVPDVLNLIKSYKWPSPKVYKFPCQVQDELKLDLLESDQIINLSDYGMGTMQVLFTPGHTEDHICLLLQPENILFSGDLILGNGSTTFENLTQYMNSLRQLELIGNSLSMILPAHGVEIKNPIAKINEYLKHRLERIKQVYNALTVNQWQSEMDVVVKVYDKEILANPALFMGALKNQCQALEYLLHHQNVESRDCTEDEKKKYEDSFSNKMWKLSDQKLANL